MSKIVVVVGHSRRDTFCEALGNAYVRGAEAGGHTARLYVTSRMSFDPILRAGFVEVQALEPDLASAHEALMAADHVVIIFPLWLGTLPAILKGFLERILQPDLVIPAKEGKFAKILSGKSARIIVTMGMPALIYRWYFGAHAIKMLKRNILAFMGVKPVRSTIYGSIESVGAEGRAQRLGAVEEMGRRAA